MASNKVRVGITTNLEERKKYWKRKYPNLQGWRIIDSGLSRPDAQKKKRMSMQKDMVVNPTTEVQKF